MVKTLSLPKARGNLDKVIKQTDQDVFVIEKNSRPVAVLMSIDEYEDYLEVHNPRIQQEIHEAMEEYRAGKARPVEELLEELKHELSRTHRTKIRSPRQKVK